MLKQLELTDPNSCMCKAQDDEPVFVLRAHDELAPAIVRAWAGCYVRAKTGAMDPAALNPVQRQKYDEAWDLAAAMEVWARANPD